MCAFFLLLRVRWLWCAWLVAALGEAPAPGPPLGSDHPARAGPRSPVQTEPGPARAQSLAGFTAAREIRRFCRVTAYYDRGTTAAGVPSGIGQCAAPADIPFGTIVYIPALDRTLLVTDRTAKRFRHNTVDIFIPSRAACRAFGRRYLECVFILPAQPPPYGSPRLERAVAELRSRLSAAWTDPDSS